MVNHGHTFCLSKVWAEGKNILIFHPGSDENSIGDHHKSKEGIKGRILHHGSHAVRHFLSCPRLEKWQATTTFWDNGWFSKRGWPANSPYIYLPSSLQNAQNVLQIKDILMQSLPQASSSFMPPCEIRGLHQDRRSITPIGALPLGGAVCRCTPATGPPASERVFWLANFLREIWASAESVHAFSFRSWLAKLT